MFSSLSAAMELEKKQAATPGGIILKQLRNSRCTARETIADQQPSLVGRHGRGKNKN